MDFNSHLICCLCNHQALNEFELEKHIDFYHADIFRTLNPVEVNVEPARRPSLPTNNGGYYQTFFGNEDPGAQYHNQMPSTSQVSAAENDEVNKISEAYKFVLNQPSLKCPHCNFFTIKVEVLQSHLEKKHSREERINPTSQDYFDSKTQMNENMIQPASLKARRNTFSEIKDRLSLPSGNQVERKPQTKRGGRNSEASVHQIERPVNSSIAGATFPQMNRGVNPALANFPQMYRPVNPVAATFPPINRPVNSAVATFHQRINPVAATFIQTENTSMLVPQSRAARQSEAPHVGRVVVDQQNGENENSSFNVMPNKRGRKNNQSLPTNLKSESTNTKVASGNQTKVHPQNVKIEEAKDKPFSQVPKVEILIGKVKPKKRERKSKEFNQQQNLVKIEFRNDDLEKSSYQSDKPKTQESQSFPFEISNELQNINKKRKFDQTIGDYHQSAKGNFHFMEFLDVFMTSGERN